MLHQTADHWRDWVRGLAIPLEWQTVVIRAAIALKLCQHEETGAIVAALTTSIPEAPGSGRNWDYRYCWIRDAYYTVQALNRLGALDVLENYLGYLRNIVDEAKGGHIQPLYAVSGEAKLDEGERRRRWPAIAAWGRSGSATPPTPRSSTTPTARSSCPTSRPSSTSGCSARRPRTISTRSRRSASAPGRCTTSPTPACGNSAPAARVHTYSSVMSWAACDRLANAAEVLGLDDRAALLARPGGGDPRARSRRRAWHRRRRAASPRPSAATSSTPACSSSSTCASSTPDDPRFLATFEAVEKGLRRGEHMLRYAAEDDFGLPETAFNFCTFWLIEALHLVGRERRGARALREDAGAADSGRPAVRGHRFRDRRAVGQLSADLFAGRTDQLRRAAVQAVERRSDEPPDRHLQPGVRAARRGAPAGAQGGLAVALAAALREYRGLWFGWSGETTEEFTGHIDLQRHDGVTTATIDLEEQDVDEYYNGYANRTLWPLFHYRIDLAEYDRSFGGGYERVNERFAETVRAADRAGRPGLGPRLSPDPARPAAARARREEPDRLLPPHPLAAGAGCWCRCPSTSGWSCSMLAYDLIGFQTEEWLESFRHYVERELGGTMRRRRHRSMSATARSRPPPSRSASTMPEFAEAAASADARRRPASGCGAAPRASR